MKETHNGIVLKKMTYNGQKVKKWKHNGVLVYSAGNIVTYYVDGVLYQEEVESGNSVLSPTTFTPSKTGYTFVGWSLSEGGAVLSECVMDSDPITLYAIMIQTVTSYSYNGGVQSFTAPIAGLYKLEAFAAGTTDYRGGYTMIYANLSKGQTVYIVVGGAGSACPGMAEWEGGSEYSITGGYNGGGGGYKGAGESAGAGGGATHFATYNRGIITNYSSYTSELLCVASGARATTVRKQEYTDDDGKWHASPSRTLGVAGNAGFGGSFTNSSNYTAIGGGYGRTSTTTTDWDADKEEWGATSVPVTTGYYKYSSLTYNGTTYNSSYNRNGNAGNGSAKITLILL